MHPVHLFSSAQDVRPVLPILSLFWKLLTSSPYIRVCSVSSPVDDPLAVCVPFWFSLSLTTPTDVNQPVSSSFVHLRLLSQSLFGMFWHESSTTMGAVFLFQPILLLLVIKIGGSGLLPFPRCRLLRASNQGPSPRVPDSVD